MNNDIQKDKELSRLYRVSATEQPPAHLDEAVLAAARREVGDRPRGIELPFFKRSWYVPVSIAAALVVTVTLFPFMKERSLETPISAFPKQEARLEAASEEKPAITNDELKLKEAMILNGGKMPEPAPSIPPLNTANQAQPSKSAISEPESNAPTKEKALARIGSEVVEAKKTAPQQHGFAADPQPIARQRETFADTTSGNRPQPTAVASAPSPAPFAMEKSAGDMQGPALQERREIASMPPASAPASGTRTPARSLSKSKQAGKTDGVNKEDAVEEDKNVIVTPQDWIRKIQQLVQENKFLEARTELDAFKKRYPYYPIPASLKQSLNINE